jgi:hypothetical protein
MPSKIWVVGEEVLAADFNNYVQEQVVATFGTAAARDAAIVAPNEGQTCYLTTPGQLLVYHGTYGWRPPWNLPWGSIKEATPFTSPTLSAPGVVACTGTNFSLPVAGRHYGMFLEATLALDPAGSDLQLFVQTPDSTVTSHKRRVSSTDIMRCAVALNITYKPTTQFGFNIMFESISGGGYVESGMAWAQDIGPA